MFWNAKDGSVLLDDNEMWYASFGYGEKALVILPGLSDGLATVKGKALMLAKPYECFFKNYPVYMFSRKEGMHEGYTIFDMAEDQARAIQMLGLENIAVLGVSEGGMIALALAARHPELVSKLVVAVSAPRINPTIEKNVTKWIGLAEKGDHKQLMVDTSEQSYSPKYLAKYRKMYPILGFVGKPKTYDRFLVNAKAIMGFDVTAELETIVCPTLIIGGEEDKIVGVEASREMYEKIPNSELFLYPGLGHAAYEEAKDFNQRVFSFIEK